MWAPNSKSLIFISQSDFQERKPHLFQAFTLILLPGVIQMWQLGTLPLWIPFLRKGWLKAGHTPHSLPVCRFQSVNTFLGFWICIILNWSWPIWGHICLIWISVLANRASLYGSDGKEFACNAGDPDLIPGLEGSPGGEHANSFQYSCLENFMARGTWWATVHRVTKSWTGLSH